MQKEHDIDRIYQEILEWHRVHDNNDDNGTRNSFSVNTSSVVQPSSYSASPRDEESSRSVARRQRAEVPKRQPSSTHVPAPRQVATQESTIDATTMNHTISPPHDHVDTTIPDIDIPLTTTSSRPGSLKGSLKEKMAKARRGSVSSLKNLFESGNSKG